MKIIPRKVRISVIMIFFNAERFIVEAIESVFAQTCNEWELLLVDDGSGDSSATIARSWAERYPDHVRYLEHGGHENRGMSASRNLGIRHATGEFIAFLDADDVYLPEKLERQLATLECRPEISMVYNATQYWYGWTGKPEDLRQDRFRTLGVSPGVIVKPPQLLPLLLRDRARTPAMCSCLIRREAVERVGGFEEIFRGMFEDQAFFFKLCLSEPVMALHGSWDRYRQHPDSCCQVMNKNGEWHRGARPSPAREAFLTWFEQYLIAHGTGDRDLSAMLQKELRPYRHAVLCWPRTALSRFGSMQSVLKRFVVKARAGEVER